MSDYRITEIKKYLKEYGLSHIFITDVIVAEYISGFHSSNVFLLISARRNTLFTDFRYQNAAGKFCNLNNIWHFVEIEGNDFKFLRAYLKKNSRVGIQSDTVTLDQFTQFKKELKSVKFIKLGNKISNISIVKMKHEISAMGRAASIADKAFNAFIRRIKIGMTEKTASNILEYLCSEYGSEKPSFDTIVLFSSHAALPHGIPSNRKLKPGDWILCDFGCTVHGFCSDMTRTMVMGKASKRQRQIYRIVLEAQEKARKAVRAGVKACDVDCCARTIIENAGYGDAFGHGTGHGVGLRIHEKPRLNRNEKTILSKDMVVTIEPGIYLKGFGGVRIEDMMVVTEKGSYCLTKTQRNLIEVKASLKV